MSLKKSGFTLIELLAAIVILAIVLSIAIPSISSLINNSTRSAFVSNTKIILKTIEYKLIEDDSYDIYQINKYNLVTDLKLANDNYENIYVKRNEYGKLYIYLVGQGKWNNLMSCGTSLDT